MVPRLRPTIPARRMSETFRRTACLCVALARRGLSGAGFGCRQACRPGACRSPWAVKTRPPKASRTRHVDGGTGARTRQPPPRRDSGTQGIAGDRVSPASATSDRKIVPSVGARAATSRPGNVLQAAAPIGGRARECSVRGRSHGTHRRGGGRRVRAPVPPSGQRVRLAVGGRVLTARRDRHALPRQAWRHSKPVPGDPRRASATNERWAALEARTRRPPPRQRKTPSIRQIGEWAKKRPGASPGRTSRFPAPPATASGATGSPRSQDLPYWTLALATQPSLAAPASASHFSTATA